MANVLGQAVYSDDGILTIEWHGGDRGVVILLSEDGTFSIARRSPTAGYAESCDDKDLRRAYDDISAITNT